MIKDFVNEKDFKLSGYRVGIGNNKSYFVTIEYILTGDKATSEGKTQNQACKKAMGILEKLLLKD